MLTQKIVSLTLVAVLMFGSAACPCVVTDADGAMSSIAEHHAHTASSASAALSEPADCGHADCLDACAEVASIASSDITTSPAPRSIDIDDFAALSFYSTNHPIPPPFIVSTGPPYRPVPPPADTPVRRYDRLLN